MAEKIGGGGGRPARTSIEPTSNRIASRIESKSDSAPAASRTEPNRRRAEPAPSASRIAIESDWGRRPNRIGFHSGRVGRRPAWDRIGAPRRRRGGSVGARFFSAAHADTEGKSERAHAAALLLARLQAHGPQAAPAEHSGPRSAATPPNLYRAEASPRQPSSSRRPAAQRAPPSPSICPPPSTGGVLLPRSPFARKAFRSCTASCLQTLLRTW